MGYFLSEGIRISGGNVSGKSLFEKILEAHGISKAPSPGETVELPIDQTLTQDATGTMACLQFEALEVPSVATKLSVSYVDHNTFQAGFQNSDDHRFLKSFAAKYGVVFSGPGNGICHQIHLERFGIPGDTLLGSDSHTSTGGGLGMLAIGAGGLDVAMAMAGHPFCLTYPEVVLVRLEGKLSPWVTAKDIILKLLQLVSVKGGVRKLFEYGGAGVATLSVAERATIANMGAETGATSSIFPSDEVTLRFLKTQGREKDFRPLSADPDASYAEVLTIELGELEPMVAQPHMPDKVCAVTEIAGLKLDQVVIGSCTNSSYMDLATVAAILKGESVHTETSLVIAPGSRQVLAALAESGALNDIIKAGARILECACGPCIGIGQSPPTDGVSLRTFNRNFKGRSGTESARLYLCSPQVAAVSAIAVDVVRGPNIKPLPRGRAMSETIEGEVLIRLGDDITTDDIMPAGAHIMSLRSNIPAISEYVFSRLEPDFAETARDKGGGFVVAGRNYGQGSSREHAALAPMVLGIKGVIARSFARIHRANLINFGILPMTFMTDDELERIQYSDHLVIEGILTLLKKGSTLGVVNTTQGRTFEVRVDLDPREKDVVMAGGLLEFLRQHQR
jgi:aconitate hydratase